MSGALGQRALLLHTFEKADRGLDEHFASVWRYSGVDDFVASFRKRFAGRHVANRVVCQFHNDCVAEGPVRRREAQDELGGRGDRGVGPRGGEQTGELRLCGGRF